jgi:hypothetical protein
VSRAAGANRVKVVFIYDEAGCLHSLSALSLSSKLATKAASNCGDKLLDNNWIEDRKDKLIVQIIV